MITIDYHTHHYRCGHAQGNIEDYIKAALNKGLTEIGISDHAPIYWMDGNDPLRPHSSCVRRRFGAWPYVIAGCLSWYGFQQAGIHPALGLLPIIPAIPHSDVEFGFFAEEEAHRVDLLNRIEHALKPPVEVILFFFGLANAGVEFSAMSEATWLVLAGLVIGKPLGITLLGIWGARAFGMPEGMSVRDIFVVGCVAAIGFTVSLFVASVAFPPGPVQDAAKMGALFSFGAAVLAIAAGRLMRVERRPTPTALRPSEG